MSCIINPSKTTEYKTRNGRLAIVSKTAGDRYAYYLGSVSGWYCAWREDGSVCNGRSRTWDDPSDIVGPWKEEKKAPKVDWSKFPAHFRYLAMDEGGSWYGYLQKPTPDSEVDMFVAAIDSTNYDNLFDIYPEDYPDFDGDWRDSLCVRPGAEPDTHKPEDEDEDDEDGTDW